MSKSTIQEIYKHNLVWEDKISRWNVLLLYHINVNSHRNDYRKEIIGHFLIDSIANNLYDNFQQFTFRLFRYIAWVYTTVSSVYFDCTRCGKTASDSAWAAHNFRLPKFYKLFGIRTILWIDYNWTMLKSYLGTKSNKITLICLTEKRIPRDYTIFSLFHFI